MEEGNPEPLGCAVVPDRLTYAVNSLVRAGSKRDILTVTKAGSERTIAERHRVSSGYPVRTMIQILAVCESLVRARPVSGTELLASI